METKAMDTAAKLSAIDAMAANFCAPVDKELKLMWIELLENYSASQVRSAVMMVIRRYEYKTLPPFAVLKKALDEISGTGEKSVEIQAIAEWGLIANALENLSSCEPRRIFHQTTEHVLRLMGGWDAALCWKTSEIDFKRRDFISLWVDSHGRVEVMRLGADAVRESLSDGHDTITLGEALAKLDAGGAKQ